jgi:hypothetical protein
MASQPDIYQGTRDQLPNNQHKPQASFISSPATGDTVEKQMRNLKGGEGEKEGQKRLAPRHVGRLPQNIRTRILELFAQFQPLRLVREAIKTEFGRDLADATLSAYDASRASCRLSKAQRDQFDALRKAYVEGAAGVAIAHQAHRLRKYEDVYDKALKAKDFSAALKAMELAAKEMGGVMTNTSTVKHEGKVEHRHMSLDDAKAELAMRLSAMVDGGQLEPMPALPAPHDGSPAPQENPDISDT